MSKEVFVVFNLEQTSPEVWGQPALMQSATERHSSSVLGLCAVTWEKILWPRSWHYKWVRLVRGSKWMWTEVNPVQFWGTFVRKAPNTEKDRGAVWQYRYSKATLSVLGISHAERVCWEYRQALCVLHTLHTWGQFAKNRAWKCRNIISSSFVLWTITRSAVGIEYLIGNLAHPPAISLRGGIRKLKRGDNVLWIQRRVTIDTYSPPICCAPGQS